MNFVLRAGRFLFVVFLAELAIIAVVSAVALVANGGVGSPALRDGGVGAPVATHQATQGAVPVATQVACVTDAQCAAYDYARGLVPAPELAPAEDGGTAYACPAGWDLVDTSDEPTGDPLRGLECLPAGLIDGQQWT